MDPKEIFELIVKADERVKYATLERSETRVRQARELLERSIREARAIGNRQLEEQAARRLADLDEAGSRS